MNEPTPSLSHQYAMRIGVLLENKFWDLAHGVIDEYRKALADDKPDVYTMSCVDLFGMRTGQLLESTIGVLTVCQFLSADLSPLLKIKNVGTVSFDSMFRKLCSAGLGGTAAALACKQMGAM